MIDLEGLLKRIDYGDRVYYDSVVGIAGTTYPIGTAGMPSDVIADVITILAALNLKNINVYGALTLAVAMEHYNFFGRYHESAGDIVTLAAGNDVDDSHFKGLIITGAQGGAGLATYKECLLQNMTGFRGLAENCAIFGTLAVATGNADYADFDHCTSVHGLITVTIGSPDRVSFKEFNGGLILTAQDAGAVLIRGISGYLEVDDMDGGTLDIYAHGADIQINADCGGGTINIFGNARVTDNSAAGCTVNDYTLDTNLADPLVMGRSQIKATTIELNQAVGAKDLFTGTDQDVVIEKLTIRIPADVSGGAMTSLSIQTDDTTNQVFISATDGAKANLTAQAQLGWTGVTLLKATKKVQLTIAGAATGIACSCDVIAEYRAVVSGGYLA